jgi:hypothetical protein
VQCLRTLPPSTSSVSLLRAHGPLVAALVLTGTFVLFNVFHHGQHLAVDRDPGVYLTTGKWLAEAGTLEIDGLQGPFATADGLYDRGAGFSPAPVGAHLQPQFPHLFGVWLAIPAWVSDAGLFLAPPVIAGLAFISLFAFLATILGQWWALLSCAVLMLSVPMNFLARDAYTEPLTMLFLFGGLWLLRFAERSAGVSLWLAAGLATGLTCMVRIDSLLYVGPLLLAGLLYAKLSERGWRRRQAACFSGALLICASVGLIDTAYWSAAYFTNDLWPRLPQMAIASAVFVGIGFFGTGLFWTRGQESVRSQAAPTRLLKSVVGAAALGLAGFLAWALTFRPDETGLPPTVEAAGLPPLEFLSQASSMTMVWLTWYLGPLVIVGGAIGVCHVVNRLGREVGAPSPALLAFMGLGLVSLIVYVWSPSITPDHPWASRRFAVSSLPLLAFGFAWFCRWVSSLRFSSPSRHWCGLPIACTAIVAAICSLVVLGWPLRDARPQAGMRKLMSDTCSAIPYDAAVLVTMDHILSLQLPVPISVWCGVPSAGMRDDMVSDDVGDLALAWRANGRQLMVLAATSEPLGGQLRQAGLITSTEHLGGARWRTIKATIRDRPSSTHTDGFDLFLHHINPPVQGLSG